MFCQKCHKSEAEQYYIGNWNGTLFAAGFCSDCVEEMGRRATFSGYGEMFRRITGWYPGRETPRANGAVPFPEHAAPDITANLRLNALHSQLKAASDREDYLEAARLRDAIRNLRLEGSCHES